MLWGWSLAFLTSVNINGLGFLVFWRAICCFKPWERLDKGKGEESVGLGGLWPAMWGYSVWDYRKALLDSILSFKMGTITVCQLSIGLTFWAHEISFVLDRTDINWHPWMTEKTASSSPYQGNNTSNDIQLWWWLSNTVADSTGHEPEDPSAWVQNWRKAGGSESCLPSLAPEPRAAIPRQLSEGCTAHREKSSQDGSYHLLYSFPIANASNPLFNCLYFIEIFAWKK